MTGKRTPDRRTNETDNNVYRRNAWKGAVYDRTENERMQIIHWFGMPESELYKGKNPSGSYACNGCRNEKESLQGMQIPRKRRNRISVSEHI